MNFYPRVKFRIFLSGVQKYLCYLLFQGGISFAVALVLSVCSFFVSLVCYCVMSFHEI